MINGKLLLKHLTKMLVTGDLEEAGDLIGLLARSHDRVFTNQLIQYARRNRVSHILYKALVERGLANSELAGILAVDAGTIHESACHRDKLLSLLVEALEEGGVDYVVFKTFNDLGVVDVDIDVIIKPESYLDAVKILLEKGFKPIDDLSKTYATGFMVKDNPVIVDLHTDITILGVPYVRRETLFSHKVRINYKAKCSCCPFNLNILDTHAEALVRIGHSVVKEAEIRLEDVSEVLKAVKEKPSELKKLAKAEKLNFALLLFTEKIRSELGISMEALEGDDEARALGVLRGLVTRSEDAPPYHLPRLASIITLLHRIHEIREDYSVLRILSNIKYPRNAAHIGGLLLKRVGLHE
jgi:hypothetical protein